MTVTISIYYENVVWKILFYNISDIMQIYFSSEEYCATKKWEFTKLSITSSLDLLELGYVYVYTCKLPELSV